MQFPHPGREHGPDAGDPTRKRWEPDFAPHARKFMASPGTWRDSLDAPTQKGEIVFWGEWEAASTVEPVETRVPGGPEWLHRPFFEGLDNAPPGAIRQNTDPFVFGDRFLYTYCRQPSNRNLRELADGSLILFGSMAGPSKQRKFVLDTVLVVAESVAHTRKTYAAEAAARTNDVFRLTTLDPMYQKEPGNRRTTDARLYLGATADNPLNGIFSFVPCLPAKAGGSFARPAIDLPYPFINPNRAQQAATIPIDDPAELRRLWRDVVRQVIASGCALGLTVALPSARL